MRTDQDEDSNQALPFASGYAPTAAANNPTAAGVCILRAVDGQPAVSVDCSVLHKAGLKTRPSSTCVPDLIITMPTLPAPLAVIMATSADPADSLDNASFMQRCSSMTNTFRTCCVALPQTLGSHKGVLQLACDARYRGKITLHYVCPGDTPACTIMQLISCCSNSPEALQLASDAWNEVVAAATAPEAVQACVAVLQGT